MAGQPLREVSPEEYRQMVSSGKTARETRTDYHIPGLPTLSRTTLTVALAAVCLLVGFAVGMSYQKHHGGAIGSTAGTTRFGGQNGYGGRTGMRGGIGSVTAISSDSITVQNPRRGTMHTYKITGTTTITNNGTNATVTDIHTGDMVAVRTDSSDTSTAISIAINPNFGGGPSGGDQSQPQSSPGSSGTPADTNSI